MRENRASRLDPARPVIMVRQAPIGALRESLGQD